TWLYYASEERRKRKSRGRGTRPGALRNIHHRRHGRMPPWMRSGVVSLGGSFFFLPIFPSFGCSKTGGAGRVIVGTGCVRSGPVTRTADGGTADTGPGGGGAAT